MLFSFPILRWANCFVDSDAPYLSDWSEASRVREMTRRISLRPNRELPFYCHPISLFVIVWLMMLLALACRISYDSYPEMGLPIFIFVLSFGALLAGYGIIRFLFPAETEHDDVAEYALNVPRLRKLNMLFLFVAIAIMALNLKLDGLPPAFGFFSFDTVNYLEYGRLKQLLFPLLISIAVNSSLDPSKLWKIAFSAAAFLSLVLYVTRGEILAALLQVFFVYSLTSRVNKRRLVISALFVVAGLAIVATLVGNNRTTQSSFFAVLQIRREFWDWPMIFLWVISYFSIPISNLCWIVHNFHFQSATLSFLYPALPAFWTPTDPHENVMGYSHVVDGVHTYLASYYLDLSYVGIVLINLVLGIGAACVMRRGLSRNFLTAAVFLGCLAYIFFVDNFIPLSTILQFLIQGFAQRYILSPGGRAHEAVV